VSARSVTILGYHKVGPPSPDAWETWYYVPENVFVAHLRHLRESGWEPIDLRALLRGLADPESLPERAALITFDDGYRSVRDVALPRLLELEWPAVLFVPTDYVGRRNFFDDGSEPEEPLCDWHELRELVDSGVAVQSHAASHRAFSELDPAARESELVRSKAALEAGLGEPVELIAYPYGDDAGSPPALRTALGRAGYRAACLYGGVTNLMPGADPYRLERLAMGPDTDLAQCLDGVLKQSD
jgi:peptidoglycan/xylan/chitin deacetylase (PgdA/CDA1 family)